MVCKNRSIYGVLGISWALITYNICPPVICTLYSILYTMYYIDGIVMFIVPFISKLAWHRIFERGTKPLKLGLCLRQRLGSTMSWMHRKY